MKHVENIEKWKGYTNKKEKIFKKGKKRERVYVTESTEVVVRHFQALFSEVVLESIYFHREKK